MTDTERHTYNLNRIRNMAPMDDDDTSPSAVPQLLRSLHHGKDISRHKQRLIIKKSGEFNIGQKGIKKLKQQYLADIFTTLIELKWRYTLILFIAAFLISWLFFGLLWWLLAYIKKDFDDGSSLGPCVTGLKDYMTAVLFSIETQHTIGLLRFQLFCKVKYINFFIISIFCLS